MESAYPVRRLSLVDCTSITVGIIIGSGIYESMGLVAGQAADVWELAGLWIAGGVFALLGSLCYAELATRFPEEGGDYVYLTKAFGRPLGFLFAWTQLWIIRPGSIGALACVFADYATRLHSLGSQSFMLYACGSIGLLTLLNMLGVRQSTWVQNLLTGVKILGLVTLVVAGLLATPAEPTAAAPTAGGSLSFAMIFVLFAYSGWNEMGCVASEVRDPRRNILRSLLAGSAIVTLIYLGLNAACWKLLGLSGMAAAPAVAAEAATRTLGSSGAAALSVLICISALGSTNGMIFTGARIYYAMGKSHTLFAPLAVWNRRFGTPTVSLALQAAVTLALLVGFGSSSDGDPRGAFLRLVIFMTPPFYLFLMLSAAAVMVIRRREPVPRADWYRMPWFPLPPLLVAAASAFLVYQGGLYIASRFETEGDRLLWPTVWVAGTLVSGLLFAMIDRQASGKAEGGSGNSGPDV